MGVGRQQHGSMMMVNAGACGLVEIEKHVLFECILYGEERGRWRWAVRDLKDGMEEYEMIKGYHVKEK